MTVTDSPDPRMTPEFVRHTGPESDVVLVGVVHDHPASVHRAARTVAEVDPAVLAVELPPVAVPLYRTASADDAPERGGEMSAAIRAATTDRVVGIDGPSARFVARLAGSVVRSRPPLATVCSVAGGTVGTATEIVRGRLAAALPGGTDGLARVDDTVEHGCSVDDDPAVQAADEQTHAGRAEAVLSALGAAPGAAFRRRTRERHMADRLRSLRANTDGKIVAVVGFGHLDRVAEGLLPDEAAAA